MQNHLSGDFTVKDKSLFNYLRLLYSSENIKIEPSACAGFEGAIKLLEYDNTKEYLKNNNITDDVLQNSTHIVWATGGKMVPEENFNEFLNTSV